MAKQKQNEQETPVEVTATEKTSEAVIKTMEDGTTVAFGNRARLVSEQEIYSNGFSILFKIVSGAVRKYSYTSEIALPKFLLEMAAFGAASKAKASTAACKTHEDILKVIELKIAEFEKGLFVSRTSGAPAELSLYQEAYAIVNKLDPKAPEVIIKVREHFANLDKDARAALMAEPAIKLEVAKIRLREAQAELEAQMEAEVE